MEGRDGVLLRDLLERLGMLPRVVVRLGPITFGFDRFTREDQIPEHAASQTHGSWHSQYD